MFRFSTYEKLGIQNLVIVGRNAIEYQIESPEEITFYFSQKNAVGFYFRFSDKYHPLAFAFFCRLSNVSKFWSQFCPVTILMQLNQRRLLTTNIFPKTTIKTEVLSNFLRFIARRVGGLAGNRFTPHSLRIGGHTFYSFKNMDIDFVHFLGRRAITKACQLYYRANAFDNIIRLDMFFRSITSKHILLRG